MTDKHCLACKRNAYQELFCQSCEQKGFFKSGLFVFLIFSALLFSQFNHISYEDPAFLKLILLITAVSSLFAYVLRQLFSALWRSVFIPMFGILIACELVFVLNEHSFHWDWLSQGHTLYWSKLPLLAMLIILFRLKPLLVNGLKFQQLDYASGSKAEATSQARESKRQQRLTEEHHEAEDEEILGL